MKIIYIALEEADTKHVWYNSIGDILLYDRPTLEWMKKDDGIFANKVLFLILYHLPK